MVNLEDYILTKDLDIDMDSLTITTLSNCEKDIIKSYVNITRDFLNIYRLFQTFKFNLQNMLAYYDLKKNDTIVKNPFIDTNEDDYIVINALVNNYASAGKTLTESLELFIKEYFKDDEDIKQLFLVDTASKIYDENFHYRLLLRLRDVSQHGHLLLNKSDKDKYCFDLEAILNTPHFSLNGQIKQQMQEISREIVERFDSNPRIAFVKTIAEFDYGIKKLYNEFINIVYDEIVRRTTEVKRLTKKNPKLVHKSDDGYNGFVFYEIDINNRLHCFNSKENFIREICRIKHKVKKDLNESQKNRF